MPTRCVPDGTIGNPISGIPDSPTTTWDKLLARINSLGTAATQPVAAFDAAGTAAAAAAARQNQILADAAARAAAVPAYVGQLARQTDTGVWYRATGTAAGNWSAIAAGEVGAAAAATAPTIATGTAAPETTPTKAGDLFIDTVAGNAYIAKGTGSAADWVRINNAA